MQEVFNLPGIVIYDNKVVKTSKIKSYIEKKKLSNYTVIYIDAPSEDFKILNRQLQELENKYLNIDPPKCKPKQDSSREYPYEYRINVNTILKEYSQEDLNNLKKWWNVD